MSSHFLIQIGYVNHENNRSCRRKDHGIERKNGGRVFGEVVPRISNEEAEAIRQKYINPEWIRYLPEREKKKIKAKIPKRENSIKVLDHCMSNEVVACKKTKTKGTKKTLGQRLEDIRKRLRKLIK